MTARKKLPKPNQPRAILAELATRLHGTSANVYLVGQSLGMAIDDSTFDALRTQESLFTCRECNVWQSTDLESEMEDVCCECQSEIDAE